MSLIPSKCLRLLLAEYRNIIFTASRFNSARHRQLRSGLYNSPGSYSFRVTKKETGTYFDMKLKTEDAMLISRNDFFGVTSMEEKAYRKLTPENMFGQLQEQLNKNHRVNAELFMVNVLIQLEERNVALKETILRRPDFYVPMILRSCGRVMSDVNKFNRKILLNRLINALEINEIPLSLSSINAILNSKLENDDEFDVKNVLDDVENRRKLQPDIDFFNCLFWQLAKTGNLRQFDRFRDLCVQRGIQTNNESDLAEIYICERRGTSTKSDKLLKRYAARNDESGRYEALGAACCGAIKGRYIDRLRILLRQSSVTDQNADRYVLKLPQDNLFEVIWILAENSDGDMGKHWSSFSQQILDHAAHNRGFFKRLFSEIERHISHGYFYSAIVLFQDMYKVQYNLESQNKMRFANQIFGRLAYRMVSSKVDSKIMIELSNRMMAFFGAEVRFYDNIVWAILTYRQSSPMEKFEQFKEFVNMIDPERERIHIILPLITSCPDLVSRCKMIFRCSTLGYKNIADLNPYVINIKILKAFFEQSRNNYRTASIPEYDNLQALANTLKSYDIPLKDIWQLYFNLLKERRLKKLMLDVSDENMANWLNNNKDLCFPKTDLIQAQRLEKMNYSLLKKLVLEEKNSEKVHEFLKRREFPPDTNFEEITEPLLYLYIETANWGYLQKLLQLFSHYNVKSGPVSANSDDVQDFPAEPQPLIKNYHLLYILRRKLDELAPNSNLSPLMEYVYELKRLFPSAVANQDTFFDTIAAYRLLFKAIIQIPYNDELSMTRVDQTVELLTSFVRLGIINLHANETLTPYIIYKVLSRMGWQTAIETWMKFQTSFHCSNGVLELFRYAIKQNDPSKIAFVSHKAKAFISQSKVDAFLAAVYVILTRKEDGAKVLSNSPVDSWEVTPVFRLTNALIASRQQTSDFPLNFMKICLEHTNLRQDERSLQFCINDWIRMCERQSLGVHALRFMELFESHGIKLGNADLEPIHRIIKTHNNLVKKWISGKNGVLNTQMIADSDTMQEIRMAEQKLHEIEIALKENRANEMSMSKTSE